MVCLLEKLLSNVFSHILNGILMEIERKAKRQNHIVIKSKAIDLFSYKNRPTHLQGVFDLAISFIIRHAFMQEKTKKFQHRTFLNHDICIASSVFRIILMIQKITFLMFQI